MTTSIPAILFVSGAGLSAWIWDDVRRRLDPSHETHVAQRPARSDASLRAHARAAVASVSADRFAVVAHSAGGGVGAEVMQLAPDRVAGFLGVCASLPRPGTSFITSQPIPKRWILSAAMRVAGTRPPESAIRKTLGYGLDPRTVDRLVAEFTPESQRYYRDRIEGLGAEGPRGYVITTRDRELPSSLQRRFAANLGAGRRYELPTGHLPMLEDPEALAATISGFLAPGAESEQP